MEERENLIPLGEIVVLSDRTSIRDAFKTLHSRHAGGFVVTEGDQSLARYVDVKALGVLVRRVMHVGSDWSTLPLRNLLDGAKGESTAIAIYDNADNIKSVHAPFRQMVPAIAVVREYGKIVGFQFSDRNAIAELKTPPPKFICEGGHENPDPDHGSCYRCPRKIIDMR